MKKLLLVILTITVVLSLGACASSDATLDTRVSELENLVDIQQAQINALEERFNNLVVTTGLNGVQDYYENESNNDADSSIYTSLSTFEYLTKETDVINVNDYPEYIWDENGDYITIDELGKLLVAKYFYGTDATASTGYQFRITFTLDDTSMSNEEFIARLSLLIIELSAYDYYTLDSPQFYTYLRFNGQTVQVQARMTLLVTDKYTLVPAIFYEELLDTNISGISYDNDIVKLHCDTFIANETFTGYVLNYK